MLQVPDYGDGPDNIDHLEWPESPEEQDLAPNIPLIEPLYINEFDFTTLPEPQHVTKYPRDLIGNIHWANTSHHWQVATAF